MASDKTNSKHPEGKPFLARVQRDRFRHNLGYFHTREEARNVEEAFKVIGVEGPTRYRNLIEPIKEPFVTL